MVIHPEMAWLLLAGACLALELSTGSGYLLWPAVSAAALAGWTHWAAPNLLEQTGGFALLTLLTTLVGRRWFKGRREAVRGLADTEDSLIGQFGRAVTAFEQGEGRVFVRGAEWAASLDQPASVAAGASVHVVAVQGSRLVVTPRTA